MTVIYHNPRCSKSRQTLALLEANGEKPQVIEYLKTPPTQQVLTELLAKLDLSPRELLRTTENEYKDLALNNSSHSDAELIELMCQYPKLIERPIVIKNNVARLGRPPKNILEIL